MEFCLLLSRLILFLSRWVFFCSLSSYCYLLLCYWFRIQRVVRNYSVFSIFFPFFGGPAVWRAWNFTFHYDRPFKLIKTSFKNVFKKAVCEQYDKMFIDKLSSLDDSSKLFYTVN